MQLVEKDQIARDHPVADDRPEFARNGRTADVVSYGDQLHDPIF